jgi:hypothetical protein
LDLFRNLKDKFKMQELHSTTQESAIYQKFNMLKKLNLRKCDPNIYIQIEPLKQKT